MKRIFGTLVLISFLGLLIVPQFASAAKEPVAECTIKGTINARIEGNSTLNCDGKTGTTKTGEFECTFATNKDCAMCCVVNTIYNITDLIFIILVALSGIMIMIGAFNLLFAAGESEKINKGRNYIIYAAVGLAVGFLARAIPALVVFVGGF